MNAGIAEGRRGKGREGMQGEGWSGEVSQRLPDRVGGVAVRACVYRGDRVCTSLCEATSL